MLPIAHLPLARRNRILDGYAAFHEADWVSLGGLLADNVEWYPEDGGAPITGRDAVISYLQELRKTDEAELFGMAAHGDSVITVDYTRTTREEGDHACADKIVFDDSGRIQQVWHCAAATHHHGHAGHPPGHSHT